MCADRPTPWPSAAETPIGRRAARACLALALILPLAWCVIYHQAYPHLLVDEPGHIGNVLHFVEGKPGWPEQMTMLPGYHFIVAALWELSPPLGLFALARLVTALFATLGTLAFACAWRRWHVGRNAATLPSLADAGPATLLFALLPLLQPFTGLAYTDAPAIAAVLAAIMSHLAGHRFTAALLFAGAASLRQTSLLWAGFLILVEVSRTGFRPLELLRRAGWLALLLAAAAMVVLFSGRLTVGTDTGTAARFNIATVHTAALLGWFLLAPVAIRHGPAALRAIVVAPRRSNPTRITTLLVLIASAAMALTFANPHPWNRELFWEGSPFTLLRNWPLVWIDRHEPLQWLSGFLVALGAALTASAIRRQPNRAALVSATVCGAALPLANNLVEPRYFIPAAVFALLLMEIRPGTTRLLIGWWALLCVVHGFFIARGLSLW